MSDAPRRVSSLGVLGDCLVDSDRERLSLSRRNRVKSMLLSALVQTGLLSAVIVIPLFATGKIPLSSFAPPTIIFRGKPHQPAPIESVGDPTHRAKPKFDPNKTIFQPPRVPEKIGIVIDRDQTQGRNATEPEGPQGIPDGLIEAPPGFMQDLLFRRGMQVAPPEPKAPRIVRKGGEVQAALLVHRVDPPYPNLARQVGVQGVVQLHAIIAKDGSVRALEAVSGHPLLAKAAMEAVLQWRYRPTLLNGEPVEVDTHITVTFTLNR